MEREVYKNMYSYEEKHWWFIARRAVIQKILSKNFQKDASRRILEVGCGSGGNLKMLSSYGILSAMELDDETRAVAASKKICPIKRGMLPADIPFDGGIDLICALDVLEHIDDDFAALQALRAKLNSSGSILITVPAFKFLWSNHDDVNHHKRRYTRRELLSLIEKAGFKVKYSTYFNTFLFPLIAFLRLVGSIFFKGSGGDVQMPSKWVNYALTHTFLAERFFLPSLSFPFGVSILLLAQKNNTP